MGRVVGLMLNTILKKYKNLPGEGAIWSIAIRKRTDKCLYEGNYSEFSIVPNSLLYWRADPFLFEYQGTTYLFAELFNRITGKGVLGVAKIKNGKCGRFKVCLNLDFHLSFPCVFSYKDEIYMLPEYGHSGNIVLYKATNFPYKWEKSKEILNEPGVDTIPVIVEDELSFLSTLHTDNKNNNNLYYIKDNKVKSVVTDDYTARSAGSLFMCDDNIIRPAQDCIDGYGCGLVFKKVNDLSFENYSEEDFLKFYPSDIKVDIKKEYIGVHTYNLSKDYEVIDLSFVEGKTLPYIIKKIFRHFK